MGARGDRGDTIAAVFRHAYDTVVTRRCDQPRSATRPREVEPHGGGDRSGEFVGLHLRHAGEHPVDPRPDDVVGDGGDVGLERPLGRQHVDVEVAVVVERERVGDHVERM